MYLGNANERRAFTGTIQNSPAWGQVRFSSVGFNTVLYGDPDLLAQLAAVDGHCVRIEGTRDPNGGITVEGWALLPDGTEFTEGGVTFTCSAFKGLVAIPGVVPDPNPPVTSGGTVTTTTPLPPGTDPTTATPGTNGAGGGGGTPGTGNGGAGAGAGNGAAPLGGMLVPLLAVASVFLLARPRR